MACILWQLNDLLYKFNHKTEDSKNEQVKRLVLKNICKILLFLLILSSCESEKENSIKIQEGTYVGTFQRQGSLSLGPISNVTITFSADKWSGQSDNSKYPALCNGTYSYKGHSLIFTNECVWTAEFDWSLILSGDFIYSFDGEHLQMAKTISPGIFDRYNLTRQE
jgi:hypothetical protein